MGMQMGMVYGFMHLCMAHCTQSGARFTCTFICSPRETYKQRASMEQGTWRGGGGEYTISCLLKIFGPLFMRLK